MSLRGNLNALSLPELLQIVALAKKTGALEICSEQGVAWLGLEDGGIVRVARDGDVLDRESVLKSQNLTPESDQAQIESALWDSAVHAILEIFDWREGEFMFEPVGNAEMDWRGPEGLRLPAPVAPEFLALEGARLEDERHSPELKPEPFNAVPVDPGMDWSDLNEGPAGVLETPPVVPPVPVPSGKSAPGVIICVDPDLSLLERMKELLARDSNRVHIFQDGNDALTRLKQYIISGDFPVFVLSTAIEDPLDARRGLGWRRFVARLRSLAPSIRLVLLRDGEDGSDSGLEEVVKPDPRFATEVDVVDFLSSLGDVLGMNA
ncbi:MAG: DUF4388 domain-containing protein [bacterium]|nr:DUF4388 domain-containing protein [bacterium]